jgi:uncharacterized protein DUF4230
MKTGLLAIVTAAFAGFLVVHWRGWHSAPPPVTWSSGPTIEHLESIRQLVCLRVHISDVLVGQDDDYRGSWLIKGDAILAIDLGQAKILERDPASRSARIQLPEPVVTLARIDHEATRTWAVEKMNWVFWRGNPDRLRDEAMQRAQHRIQSACSSPENVQLAKSSAATIIQTLYRLVDWNVDIAWVAPVKK